MRSCADQNLLKSGHGGDLEGCNEVQSGPNLHYWSAAAVRKIELVAKVAKTHLLTCLAFPE